MPQLDASVFAGFCQPGIRPLAMTQAILLWLRYHYGNTNYSGTGNPVAGQLENQDPTGPLPRMVWLPTPATQLAIEADWAWKPELTERRPAIIVQRGDHQTVKYGINDMMQCTFQSDGDMRYELGWNGQHTVLCIGGDGIECELLAAETMRELVQFAPVVREILDLKRIKVEGLGKMNQLETDGRYNFVIPIPVAYHYTDRWIVEQMAPPLTGVSQAISWQ